jgi:hypothetical protein
MAEACKGWFYSSIEAGKGRIFATVQLFGAIVVFLVYEEIPGNHTIRNDR